jgi:hypothetical protein
MPLTLDAFLDAVASSGVTLRQEDDVRRYLDEHPDLLDAVTAVCRTSRQVFGSEGQLSLALYRDPEIKDNYLVLLVRLPAYPPDMLARIRAVSDAHEQELENSSGTFLVTTDFRPAR